MQRSILAALALAVAVAAPAAAAVDQGHGAPPSYAFPSGLAGFRLATHGGIVNPGVLVGFNPQPDPPGFPAARLFVGDGSVRVNLPDDGDGFTFLISLTGLGVRALEIPPDPVRGITSTGFDAVTDGISHHYVVGLAIRGPGDVANWAAFNPQPDPPGIWFGTQFNFAALGDPDIVVTVSEDGTPLQFSLNGVPEPATWATMLAGFGVVGGLARQRRRRQVAA